MNVEYHVLPSQHLQREMPFKRYGHSGKPVIVFPSSGGRFYEYEDFGMVEACRPFIERGLIQIYTPDSIDNETWLDKTGPALERARLHNRYDAYISEELVPLIRKQTGWEGLFLATGCSMGGFHSTNFFFKHPDVFDTLISLSGLYDARFFAGMGEILHESDVYLNSPIDYLPHLDDPSHLDRYRQSNIIICTGRGAWEAEAIRDTRLIEDILRSRQIPAWIDYWGSDVDHDWPWWRKQIVYFLGRLEEQGKL